MGGDREPRRVPSGQEEVLHAQSPSRPPVQACQVVHVRGAPNGFDDRVITHVPHEGAGRSTHADAPLESPRWASLAADGGDHAAARDEGLSHC
eukprot:9983170-Lingulodinium_polyedra.AAC.1